MKYLTIDFETQDPYLKLDLGPGWCYEIKNKSNLFRPLCCGYRTYSGQFGITSDWNELKELVESHDAVIVHNAMYDCGCFLALGIPLKSKIIVDTVVLSKLFRNNVLSHKLGALSKLYLLEKKTDNSLGEAAWNNNLFPYTVADAKRLAKDPTYRRKKPSEARLNDWAYANMDIMFDKCKDTVEKYCIQDVNLTWQLFIKFGGLTQDTEQQEIYSNVLKALMKMRLNGIRINLDRAREVHQILLPKIAKAYQDCYDIAGEEFNIRSIKDVPRILDKLHIKYPRTKKGNPNIDSDWLKECEHPIANAISLARRLHKLDSDFIQKLITMQQYTLGVKDTDVPNLKYGRIHPTITLFGASKTGRFSSRKPNIQQIPKHDKEYASLVRSIFLPEEGEQWYKSDYSNQEGRIQLHFAQKLMCPGVDTLVTAYRENPRLDMHQKVADMANITRDQAKTISHGIGFGMGTKKLCKALKVDYLKGQDIIANFHEHVPYLKDFMSKCIKAMESKNYIKTLLSRKLFNDRFFANGQEMTLSYKAISKVVQGSAADQTILALNQAYKDNIPVLCIVHDEFNISTSDIKVAERMEEIMKTCVLLEVPVEVETTVGESWGEASFPSTPVDKTFQLV